MNLTGWAAAEADKNPWLEWDFGALELHHPAWATITEVQLSGRRFGQWITSFILEYTRDGKRWTLMKDAFAGNSEWNETLVNKMDPPFTARKVRMHVVDWHGAAAGRVEFKGCVQVDMSVTLTTTSTTTTITTTTATTTSTRTCKSGWSVAKADGISWPKPSLFCWLLTTTNTEELALVRDQKSKHWGIFTCEEHAVLSDTSVEVGADECSIAIGSTDCQKGGWGSWINSWAFVKAWETIVKDGRYKQHDWVVKVDPDTVFFADRLKAHMQGASGDDPWWLKNVPFSGYPTIGALEVFSRAAMDAYSLRGSSECDSWAVNSAEDEWICKCVTKLGAHPRQDDYALQHMKGDQCSDGRIVAFHPHKTVWSYERCVNEAMYR